MTNLSWLIYLSDVLSSLKDAMIFVSIVCAVLYLGQWVLVGVTDGRWKVQYSRTFIGGCLFFAVLSAVFPNRSTMLMIAAAEAGNSMIHTEEARGVFQDALGLLRKRLADATKEEAPRAK